MVLKMQPIWLMGRLNGGNHPAVSIWLCEGGYASDCTIQAKVINRFPASRSETEVSCDIKVEDCKGFEIGANITGTLQEGFGQIQHCQKGCQNWFRYFNLGMIIYTKLKFSLTFGLGSICCILSVFMEPFKVSIYFRLKSWNAFQLLCFRNWISYKFLQDKMNLPSSPSTT